MTAFSGSSSSSTQEWAAAAGHHHTSSVVAVIGAAQLGCLLMLTPTKFTYTFVSNEVWNFEKKARDANNIGAFLFGWLFIAKILYKKF
jgi:RsiW-degrading membrane proteinase PrsW (M82 family)